MVAAAAVSAGQRQRNASSRERDKGSQSPQSQQGQHSPQGKQAEEAQQVEDHGSPQSAGEAVGSAAGTSSGGRTGKDSFFLNKDMVRRFYLAPSVQVVIATLIGSYFMTQCVNAQIDPHGVEYPATWIALEDFFNIVFTLELGVNFYAHKTRAFFSSGWNLFDIIVVALGLLDLARLKLEGIFNAPLRMLRVFRVFRLFGRVESLRVIIIALKRATPGVCNAAILISVTMCIYASLAVEFFMNIHQNCSDKIDIPGAISYRGQCFGDEYYGTFLRSLYTMFQVLTGESWSEAVVRPILFHCENDVWCVFGVAFFFISYTLLMVSVLCNVVVAVLLDGMGNIDLLKEEIERAKTIELALAFDQAPPPELLAPPVPEEDLQEALRAARKELIDLKHKVSAFDHDWKKQIDSFMQDPEIDNILFPRRHL